MFFVSIVVVLMCYEIWFVSFKIDGIGHTHVLSIIIIFFSYPSLYVD
jgi:hypothetical protein